MKIMKYIASLKFILITLIANICYSQSCGEITYEIKNIDFEPKKESKIKNFTEQTITIAKSQQFILQFNGSKSKFFKNSKEIAPESKEKMLDQLASVSFTCSFSYFLDTNLNLEFFKEDDGTLIKEMYKKKEWEITSESKTIDKYLCYKATYKYDYLARDNKVKTRIITAWFTPSLPFSYGPKNYNGLPGLILELQDWNTTFLATKIELSDKEIKIDFPKGKTITQEEYERKVLSGN